jgi:hypothetical protein
MARELRAGCNPDARPVFARFSSVRLDVERQSGWM